MYKDARQRAKIHLSVLRFEFSVSPPQSWSSEKSFQTSHILQKAVKRQLRMSHEARPFYLLAVGRGRSLLHASMLMMNAKQPRGLFDNRC